MLGETNRRFDGLWSESELQKSVARSYSRFFWAIAFAVPLLSASLFMSLTEGVGQPESVFSKMARNTPGLGYTFAMLVLLQVGSTIDEAYRAMPYFT